MNKSISVQHRRPVLIKAFNMYFIWCSHSEILERGLGAENNIMVKNWGFIPSPNTALSFTHNLQADYKHDLLHTIYRSFSLQEVDF